MNNSGEVRRAWPFRALVIATALALAPSATGYLYLRLFSQSLVGAGVPYFWAYYLCLLLVHLTTVVWLLVWMRGEVKPFRWGGILHYLTLDRIDRRGLLSVLPLFVVTLAVAAPSLGWLGLPPTIPPYDPGEASGVMASVLGLAILVATLIAEEGYYRVFLMKKLTALGSMDWMAAGALFGLYHWYALPWPFILSTPLPLGLLAAFVFKRRQNIYPVILLHGLAIVAGNIASVLVRA